MAGIQDYNPNTEWIHRKRGWFVYFLMIFSFRLILAAFDISPEAAWTLVNMTHAVVTFFLFHWVKGTPFEDWLKEQGKYDKYTFWEQIELGHQFTPTKKFLTVCPVVLFLFAVYHSTNKFYFFVNFFFSAVITVAKLPGMHLVRILGINK